MIRNTKQRDMILDIVNHSCNHPTAYDIYNECRKVISNISLGTVYRNLSHLVYEGLIKKIGTDDDNCRYDNVIRRHSHFFCSECGKIIDVFEDYFVDAKDIQGNSVNDYDIKFYGVCYECQREE